MIHRIAIQLVLLLPTAGDSGYRDQDPAHWISDKRQPHFYTGRIVRFGHGWVGVSDGPPPNQIPL